MKKYLFGVGVYLFLILVLTMVISIPKMVSAAGLDITGSKNILSFEPCIPLDKPLQQINYVFEGALKGNLGIDKSMDYYGKKNIAIEIRNYDILNKSRTSGGSGWIIIDDKNKFEYIGLTIPNSYKGCTYSWFKEPNELENANPILDKSCFFETPQKINIRGETYSNPYNNVTTNKNVKVELSVSDQKDPGYQEFVKGIVDIGDKTLWIDVEQVDISCITPTN